jgi:hypothetical protein
MNEGVDIASCDSVDGRAVACVAKKCLYFPAPRGSELGVSPLTALVDSVAVMVVVEAAGVGPPAVCSTPVEIAAVEVDADAIIFFEFVVIRAATGVWVGENGCSTLGVTRRECQTLCAGVPVRSIIARVALCERPERMGTSARRETGEIDQIRDNVEGRLTRRDCCRTGGNKLSEVVVIAIVTMTISITNVRGDRGRGSWKGGAPINQWTDWMGKPCHVKSRCAASSVIR